MSAMNKFVILVFVAVFLRDIQSKSKTPSINKVPYYELEKHHVIKGEHGIGKIQTDDVTLYENNANLKTGKLHIKSSSNNRLYVNDLLVLDQNPNDAPIQIPNPHLKCENVSSFNVDIDPIENLITYTIKTNSK